MERNVADAMGQKRQPEEMLPLLKRHEVQVLRRAGHSRAQVEKLTGVASRTIQRIDREDAVERVDDGGEAKRRRIGRPSKAEPFRPFVQKLLKEEPEILSVELLRRAKLEGYTGSKSALFALVAPLRPPSVRPMVRFEGLAGEFSQHDFGEVDVRFMDGSTRRVKFFASRLKFSRWVQVTIVTDEGVETLVRTLVVHFEAIAGVPLLAVFDRPKTVAISWTKDGAVTEWNKTFAQVMLELGVGVEVCWPYSGNQKGSVERLVGWVKGSFFKQRRFMDMEDLERQLAEWHVEVNTVTISRATGVTHEVRMAEERPRLRPVKVSSDDLALRIPVVVGPTGMVLHDTHLYSMPPEAIGIGGTLYLYRDRVRIVAGRHSSEHERLFQRGAKSVLPEHRAKMVAAVSGKRAKRYYKREQLLGLGPVALDYLTELVHRRPDRWVADVEDLYDLQQAFGDELVLGAIQLALGAKTFGAEYVGHFIERLVGQREVPS
jgi:transposase